MLAVLAVFWLCVGSIFGSMFVVFLAVFWLGVGSVLSCGCFAVPQDKSS